MEFSHCSHMDKLFPHFSSCFDIGWWTIRGTFRLKINSLPSHAYISANIHPTCCYARNKYSVTNTHRQVLMSLKCPGIHPCPPSFSPSSFDDPVLAICKVMTHNYKWRLNISGPIQPNCSGLWSLTCNVRISDTVPPSPTTSSLESCLYAFGHLFSCSSFSILLFCHFCFSLSSIAQQATGKSFSNPAKLVWRLHRIGPHSTIWPLLPWARPPALSPYLLIFYPL